MLNTTAMILAGGRGKRMDIFCHQRPKPILPFGGRYRVIDFTLSNCLNSNIDNIAVLADYQRASIMDYIQQWSAVNHKAESFSVLQPGNGSFNGTADAVYQNLDYLRKRRSQRVLILAGDHIYKMDYRKMLDFHPSVNADVTVGVIRVPISEACRFGTVGIDSGSRIREFVEKSPSPRSNLASMGIYLFNTDILAKRLSEDSHIRYSLHDFGYSILPAIIKTDKVFAFEFKDYWQDIGTVEAYYESNMALLDNSHFNINQDWPVFTNSASSSVSADSNTGRIVNSLVSPGCVVKGYVQNSVLSPGVLVQEHARVINSVVMNNTVIGSHSVVDRCILDEEIIIGEFCHLGFGSAQIPGVWDITMLGREVSVPSQTAIGRKCKIHPGIKVMGLQSNLIISGSILTAAT